MAKRIGNWLLGLGCLGLILALFPSFFYQAGGEFSPLVAEHLKDHPDAMPTVERYSLGWVSSPLVSYQIEKTIADNRGAIALTQSNDLRVGWLSWSSLSLGIGLALLWAGRKLTAKPKEAMKVTSPA